ncbi:MAG: DUF2336 domain-containing protein [Xanthobacteraceae bacterium]
MILSVADLFAAVADRIGDAEMALFDDLLLDQLPITDHETQVALSKRLSTISKAPPKLIHRFASDASVDIAGPVLSRSKRLKTDDLVRYAVAHGQDHLHAICERAEIPEILSATLIERGGQSVIDRLAQTDGAKYYAADFVLLLKNATVDERKRARVKMHAVMETQLGQPISDCAVLNISPTGAHLVPDQDASLPETFAVVFPAIEGRRTLCRMAWKNAAGLGASFQSDPFAQMH